MFRIEISGPIGISPSADTTSVVGTYLCTYKAAASGTYSLEIRVGRGGSAYQDLITSAYTLLVHPSETSPSYSTANGNGLTISTAGVTAAFVIVAMDSLQNRRPGGDEISILMYLSNASSTVPATGVVADKSDGSYDVTYVFTCAGTYQLQITFSDIIGVDSPYSLTVYPARASIANTYGYGYIFDAAAGEYSTIYVQTRDTYGNAAVCDTTLHPKGVEIIEFEICHLQAGNSSTTSTLPCAGMETRPRGVSPYAIMRTEPRTRRF
jgi:hypothetical protein